MIELIKVVPWWQLLVGLLALKYGATILDLLRQGAVVKGGIPGILEFALRREIEEPMKKEQPPSLPKGVSPAGADHVIEAKKFILRSPDGALRLEIGVADTDPFLPFVRFFDEHGDARALLGLGKDGAGLYLTRKDQRIASLSIHDETHDANLRLPGKDNAWGYIDSQSIALADRNGKVKAAINVLSESPGAPGLAVLRSADKELFLHPMSKV